MRRIPKALPGFSLLEMAIVLCIVGIIGGVSLPVLTATFKQQKIHRTEQNLAQIKQALASYVLNYKRLPCAAPPRYRPETAGLSEAHRMIGCVPYKTLGLPESVAKDGYHHWITYAVLPELTYAGLRYLMTPDSNEVAETVFCEVKNSFTPLEVRNQYGQSVLSPASPTDFIAFVLISHGASGQGSFDDEGQRRPTFHPDKIINARDDMVFIDRPVSMAGDNFFDDTVQWVTRDNLMAFYAQKPCQRREDPNQLVN